MADPLSARQQIVDKIKSSSNILVTVSRNPSVDELSAALGLTAMLNDLKKHATAIVSGDIPPAITFLDPDKTFENTVDSLRDFIIALDKEKADHLRYKVDGDVVKIFITPYRTTISQADLEFTQGDYNVEFVIAIGVKDEAHLDAALEAHGKILHDAAVATIDNEGEPSKLGSIDWRDEKASSISEMLVSLSEAIKGDKPVLDEQISTALLTGIVSATDRFSNNKTSSKVMTMAAQLMAAGANQQLIATKLQEAQEISTPDAPKETSSSDGTTSLAEGEQAKLESTPAKEETGADGSLAISHEKEGSLEEVADQVSSEQTAEAVVEATDALNEAAQEKAQEDAEDAARAAEQKLAEELQATIPSSQTEPLLGSALNATSEQAADDKRREEDDDRNKTLLTHGESGHVASDAAPLNSPPLNSLMQDDGANEPPTVDPFADASPVSSLPPEEPAPAPAPEQSLPPVQSTQTLADLDASVRSHEDPREAIDAVFAAQPDPTSLPPMPDLSTLPPPPPPLPDLPPLQPSGAVPTDQLGQIFSSPTPPPVDVPAPESPNDDPNQFKIPGQ